MNINDIAQLAGVSPSTVSKVMNGRDSSISSETRRRVLEVAKRYHYQPYASAMQQGGRTLTIGALVHDAAAEGQLVAGMLRAAGEEGYSLLLEDGGCSPEGELRAVATLVGRHVDGIIWSSLPDDDPRTRDELRRSGIPSLEFGIAPEGAVGIDYELIGYVATSALVDAGHEDIACVAGTEAADGLFTLGYRRCLFERGLTQREDLVMDGEEGHIETALGARRFTAAVTSRYPFATKLCDVASRLHYRVPRDLSIVSAAPLAGTGFQLVCSTVSVPLYEMGEMLVHQIVCAIEGCDSTSIPEIAYRLDSQATIAPPSCPSRKRVVSLGSINVDNYLSFDVLPRAGTSNSTSQSSVFPGGKCTNEAIGVARLGHAVTAIGRVGDDADADVIFSVLGQHGVDVAGVRRVGGERTGQAYIFIDKTGNSMISIMSGANGSLTPGEVIARKDLFKGAQACLLQTEVPMEAVVTAAAIAKEYGALTVVKPSACGVLPKQLLESTDILVPNQNELDAVVPGDLPLENKVDALMGAGVGAVVVTMGPDGCAVYTREGRTSIEALGVASVDDTGAGDAFISALVSYMLHGFDMVSSARIATYAAGLSITRQGVVPGLVDRETLEAFIAQKEPELLQ